MSLHPSEGNSVTLMVGTLSGIGQKALGCEIDLHICLSFSGCDMCSCSLSVAVYPLLSSLLSRWETIS